MRTFLPNVLSQNLYTYPFWIGTKFNTADDPTRDVPVRPPPGPYPSWALDVIAGSCAALDCRAEHLSHDASAPALSDLATAQTRLTDTVVATSACLPAPADCVDGVCPSDDSVSRRLFGPALSSPPALGKLAEPVTNVPLPPTDATETNRAVPPKSEASVIASVAASLLDFPKDAFMFADGCSLHSNRPGALSLFAGSRRWERSMLSRGCPWVLCIDTLHHPDLDLTNPSLRKKPDLLSL